MTIERGELDTMSEALIQNAIDLARSRVAQAEQGRAELERVIDIAREEERLLMQLLALKKGETGAESPVDSGDKPRIVHPDRSPISSEDSAHVSRHGAVEAVVHELTEAGRPVHISDLMRLLRTRGVTIPGSGTQANLISHLRRDARLMRASRGMYGLTEWGLEEMQPMVRRRRKRRVSSKGVHKGSST